MCVYVCVCVCVLFHLRANLLQSLCQVHQNLSMTDAAFGLRLHLNLETYDHLSDKSMVIGAKVGVQRTIHITKQSYKEIG